MFARVLAVASFFTAAYAVARLVVGPTPASLTILEIPGGSEREGREGTSDIFGVNADFGQEFDPSTGDPIAAPQHGPFIVLKLLDRASPLLHEAWATSRVLPSVTLDWYRINPQTRLEEWYYVITLTEARVVGIETFMPTSFLPENESYRHMERLSFTFQGIEWKWLPDSIAARDRLIDGPPADADANGDLRIDLSDVASFQRCVPMPSSGWFTCDDTFDFNSDYEIDSADWIDMVIRLSGP